MNPHGETTPSKNLAAYIPHLRFSCERNNIYCWSRLLDLPAAASRRALLHKQRLLLQNSCSWFHRPARMSKRYATTHNTGCFHISSDGVRIVVDERVSLSAHEDKAVHSWAHGQCLALVAERAPQSFRVATLAQSSSSSVDICISQCLVERLPVLLDIASCTVTGSSIHSTAKTDRKLPKKRRRDDGGVELSIPFGVCGLVTLLLLLEESVTLQHWFDSCRQNNAFGLAGQTLQV